MWSRPQRIAALRAQFRPPLKVQVDSTRYEARIALKKCKIPCSLSLAVYRPRGAAARHGWLVSKSCAAHYASLSDVCCMSWKVIQNVQSMPPAAMCRLLLATKIARHCGADCAGRPCRATGDPHIVGKLSSSAIRKV